MHGLTRRAREQGGVVAAILSLFVGAGILVVLAALVVDIGAMQVERRELQNGAEAAAMAAAYECSFVKDPGRCDMATLYTKSAAMAGFNAKDGLANAYEVCGQGLTVSGLAGQSVSCTQGGSPRNCASTPVASKWVRVTASTLTSGGSNTLRQFFTRALPWFGPRSVKACAQAAWGVPGSMPLVLGVTMSKACWQAHPAAAVRPTYSASNPEPVASEFALVLGNSISQSAPASACAGTLQGSNWSGGFGWLSSSPTCSATITYGETTTGNSNPGVDTTAGCKAALIASYNPTPGGRVVAIAVFDGWSGTGSGQQYNIVGFAPFYITGWALTGNTDAAPRVSANTCRGSDKCLYGWFVESVLISPTATLGNLSQTNYGLSIVQLAG